MNVWVIVLNWNGKDDTAACLESLRAVQVPPGVTWTRLVVDNGSADGSLEMLPSRFPEARFLATGQNLRWAGGNNRGIEEARRAGADGVFLLNNDTVVEPDFLARLLEAVASHPEGGLFGPTILSWDGRRVWSAGGDWSAWLGWGWHRGLGAAWSGVADAPGARGRDAVPCTSLTGAALYATRACLDAVGGLDEGYYLYAEDADWCLRARRHGFACLWVPRSIVRHRVSGSSGAASPFKAYHRTRGGLRLAARGGRPWHALVWPWASTALLLAQSVAWGVRGGGTAAFAAAWRAWADHWRNVPPERAARFQPRREAA